ncbi:hypothetical protein AMELA_G00206050 [Ameiurus melas]|uniref:RRM domain-containing protein n=1 Tax=Ameiurus melas TaxID=219545 RepID=A0A7J6A5M5_AMEME|nr:hypothetical protein AMELA_G00206050 [Ameiurus melas]
MVIDTMILFDSFSVFGKVVGDEKGSKGYGYIHFESAEAADLAMKRLNGKLMNGHNVINLSEDQICLLHTQPEGRAPPRSALDCTDYPSAT